MDLSQNYRTNSELFVNDSLNSVFERISFVKYVKQLKFFGQFRLFIILHEICNTKLTFVHFHVIKGLS